MIPWGQLLLLLEGDVTNFPAPKNEYKRNIVLSNDTPIFATSGSEIVYVKHGELNCHETDMMARRWKVFTFSYQIDDQDAIDIKSCPVCFAKFALNG